MVSPAMCEPRSKDPSKWIDCLSHCSEVVCTCVHEIEILNERTSHALGDRASTALIDQQTCDLASDLLAQRLSMTTEFTADKIPVQLFASDALTLPGIS